ncbi:MAG: D-aminoacyl-tRNA deacylase [Bacteroidia bacterium]
MKVVIQRVQEAAVKTGGEIKSEIGAGLLVLVGFEAEESSEEMQWMASKIANLRIFNDDAGAMNFSVKDVNGELLAVSQFTLHATTKKGNRPSFNRAAPADAAITFYKEFITLLAIASGRDILTGAFGADMQVSLVNDGPVTIIIDSKNKE